MRLSLAAFCCMASLEAMTAVAVRIQSKDGATDDKVPLELTQAITDADT